MDVGYWEHRPWDLTIDVAWRTEVGGDSGFRVIPSFGELLANVKDKEWWLWHGT